MLRTLGEGQAIGYWEWEVIVDISSSGHNLLSRSLFVLYRLGWAFHHILFLFSHVWGHREVLSKYYIA